MDPFLGEIRMFGARFPPIDWELCDGGLLPVSGYAALFELIGTTYGGDGENTFALPDLRGRVVVHEGGGFRLGELAGAERITLTSAEMPAHSHAMQASSKVASESDATGRVPATLPAGKPLAYGTDKPYATIDPSAIGSAGGGSAHNNIQPYLAVTFIICTNGTFPPPG